jgi:hypothetical protein
MSKITRHHSHHYLGFAANQRDLLQKDDPPRVKPLLHVYRVILTGIYLMRTGHVEPNLLRLNEELRALRAAILLWTSPHLPLPEHDTSQQEYPLSLGTSDLSSAKTQPAVFSAM